MPYLEQVFGTHLDALVDISTLQAPRKTRVKYGKRKEISPLERAELNRERNREHAKSTRMRRKVSPRGDAASL
jgi:hypothetical protein